GFAQLESNGYIDCFYVHHLHQRQGIGAALMAHIHEIARDSGMDLLYTYASVTARPFFERHGFHVVREQTVAPNGVTMRNFAMEKRLRDDIRDRP
ncbi:MAG: GNAT family N-acetyltransferase, partial [Dongiaceae bacterium]